MSNVYDLRARLEQVPMPANGPPAITFGMDEDSEVVFRDMATLNEFIAEVEDAAAKTALAPVLELADKLEGFSRTADETARIGSRDYHTGRADAYEAAAIRIRSTAARAVAVESRDDPRPHPSSWEARGGKNTEGI